MKKKTNEMDCSRTIKVRNKKKPNEPIFKHEHKGIRNHHIFYYYLFEESDKRIFMFILNNGFSYEILLFICFLTKPILTFFPWASKTIIYSIFSWVHCFIHIFYLNQYIIQKYIIYLVGFIVLYTAKYTIQ